MIIMILFFICTSFLLQNVQNDLGKGLVYPEKDKLIYFDPHLQEFSDYNKEELESFKIDFNQTKLQYDALNRFSALFHETFIENDYGETLINFLPTPVDKYFIVNDNPNGSKMQTELVIHIPNTEQRWRFHDNSKVTIEDIYYSMQYAILTQKNIPQLYQKVDLKLVPDEEKIIVLYNFQISEPLIIKHLRNLIIFPAENIKDFVDGNAKITSPGFKKLNDIYNRDLNVKKVSSKNLYSAGPFRIHPIQDESFAVRLDRYKKYGRGFPNNADIEVVNIRHDDIRSGWFGKVVKGDYNLAINISTVQSTDNSIEVERISSFDVSSLMVNYNNEKQPLLKNKSFREAISIIINRDKIISQILDGEADKINGPYSQIQEPSSGFQIKYDPNKFKKLMKDLNCELVGNYYHYKGKPIELGIVFLQDPNEARPTLIVDAIVSNLNRAGIKAESVPKSESRALISYLKKDFDLYFNTEKIRPQYNLKDYYSFKDGEAAKDNDGGFNPDIINKDLNKKIIRLRDNCGEDDVCQIRQEEVWRILAENYVNIYLWSPNYYYAFNTDYIYINYWNVDSDQFFINPHTWNIFE